MMVVTNLELLRKTAFLETMHDLSVSSYYAGHKALPS